MPLEHPENKKPQVSLNPSLPAPALCLSPLTLLASPPPRLGVNPRRPPPTCLRRRSTRPRSRSVTAMETYTTNTNQNLEVEEYVLLDLDAVCGQVDIPPDEPYVLSGLDTLNPILSIGNNLKLIGEYEETIGTCLIFSENEKPPSVCEGSGSLEANISKGTLETDHNQNPSKLIKPVTSLQKILKFRLLPEADEQDLRGKPPDAPSQKERL